MKKFIVGIVVFAFFAGASLCVAEPVIPDMMGTWMIKAEGGVIVNDSAAESKSHHSGDFSNITAEFVVTKQQGRVFHGNFTSKKGSKTIIGVIGMDNKSIFCSDADGFAEGRIVSKNKVHVIYRHSTPADSVVAAAVWTRKK
jgi:hypothetical protein